MSNDHTEAATITPEAKPNNDFCNKEDICLFIRNTNAEPSMVPNRGMSKPKVIVVMLKPNLMNVDMEIYLNDDANVSKKSRISIYFLL